MKQTRRFSHAPASVTGARRFAREVLSGLSPDRLEAVELMVSELATNCVLHTSNGFEITVLRSPQEIRIEASDRGHGSPRLRSPGPTDPHGRGLLIVDALADAWGVDQHPDAKVVWFTVPAAAR